ncbi:GNAT family N-acetyltransferase [Fluviicola sp.]|uniref:GNAT family N-acetyltransferase n=1 Tax=Fluviicola sp. TaxID=1917219 RepID=UPI0031DDE8FE
MKVAFKLVEHGSEEWKAAVRLREDILRKPLGSYFTDEELEEEKNHIQIVGLVDGEIIATTVLVPENQWMKMQRVVVKEELRSSGIGSEMMAFCEKISSGKGKHRIFCHARDTAVNFYLNNHYLVEGAYFPEDGIPHVKMVKQINNL